MQAPHQIGDELWILVDRLGNLDWLDLSGTKLTNPGLKELAALPKLKVLELSDTDRLDKIVLTHAHVDHIGGVKQVRAAYGNLEVIKKPWPEHDPAAGTSIAAIEHGERVTGEGVTLKAVHTPGHAPDHICYYLEEEKALFTGDVVLGAGTTVIPDDTGDLGQYMDSLHRLLELDLETIYPAHGPVIRNPKEKIREYIAHRELRDRQILAALADGPMEVMPMRPAAIATQ